MVPAVVKKKRALPLAVLAALTALGGVRPARAHPEVSPQLVNRYLSLIVVGDRLQYFVTLLYGALPAVPLRKQLDQDGDGRISESERQRGVADWKRRAPELATLTVDGAPVPLAEATADVQLGPDSGTGPAPAVVELFGARPLPEGLRRLTLQPGWDPPRLGETEVVLDLPADWELVSSQQGAGGAQQLTRYKIEGPPGAGRAVTFVIRPLTTGRRRPPALIPIAAVVGTLALIGLVLEITRRRRR
jgi:hypothetical protein